MAQRAVWEAALEYGARGWRVAPAALGLKYPYLKEWPVAASANAEVIASRFPDSKVQNVCIVTGEDSNLWVLDIDTKDGKVGEASLAELVAEVGELPDTYTVRTWSGGRQMYFTWDGVDFDLRNSTGKKGKSALGVDLDIRGNGGQVVAPPSSVANQPYTVLRDVPVVAAPAALLAKIKAAIEARTVTDSGKGSAILGIGTVAPERARAIGKQAMNRASLDIRVSAPHTRNQTINDCAFTLGRLVARGCMSEAEAGDTLVAAADMVGHGSDVATIRSGLSAGIAKPKTPWPPVDRPLRGPTGQGRRADAAAVATTVDTAGGQEKPARGTWPDDFNDAANADLFVRHARGSLLALSDRQAWAAWDGRRWITNAGQGRNTAARLWVSIAEDWPVSEVNEEGWDGDEDGKKAAEKQAAAERAWRKSSLMAAGIRNCLQVAEISRDLSATMAAFDNNLTELNTPGGIVDLGTGAMRECEAGAMHSQITYCAPANGIPTKWLLILEAAFGGEQSWIDYLQTLMGYSLTGVQTDAVFPFLQGIGGAGKSVIMNTFGNIMGDYSGSMPSEVLMAGPQKHAEILARLNGKRFVRSGEVHEKDRFDEQKLRLLTGGDEITANYMRENSFEFTPTHHLWMHGNELPRVASGGESATWRRVIRIPFTRPFPEELKEKRLVEKLVASEGGQILTWAMEGAARYLSDGLVMPVGIRAATDDYKAEQDEVGRFLDEEVDRVPGQNVIKQELYASFRSWCEREGIPYPMTSNALTVRMKAKGYDDGKAMFEQQQHRCWLGVRVRKGWVGHPFR